MHMTLNMEDEGKRNLEGLPPPYLQHEQPPPMEVPVQSWGQPMMAPKVGKLPEVITCPNCRAQVRTRVERSLSPIGWIWSLVLWWVNQCISNLKLLSMIG